VTTDEEAYQVAKPFKHRMKLPKKQTNYIHSVNTFAQKTHARNAEYFNQTNAVFLKEKTNFRETL
jgi:hypothetical protein